MKGRQEVFQQEVQQVTDRVVVLGMEMMSSVEVGKEELMEIVNHVGGVEASGGRLLSPRCHPTLKKESSFITCPSPI